MNRYNLESQVLQPWEYIKIFIGLISSVLMGGCITTNYYCKCGEGCKCAEAPVVQSGEPIVSPDKIDNTKQEDGTPQYPNIKPWYIKN